MDDLVVAALQEGRIDRAEGLHAVGGKAAGKGHGMLLGDADVEGAFRECLAEQVDPGARRHGRRDRHDPVVLLGFLDQGVGEDLGVARRVRRRLVELAGDDVELADAVIPVRGGLGRLVALALLGDAMDQDRAALRVVADIFQNRDQVVQVVPVDRADIVKAQFLEQGAAGQQAAGIFLGPLGRPLDLAREISRPASW